MKQRRRFLSAIAAAITMTCLSACETALPRYVGGSGEPTQYRADGAPAAAAPSSPATPRQTAETTLESATEDLRTSSAVLREQLALARVHQARGNHAEARRHFQAMLRADPVSFDANYEYGRLLRESGDYDAAINTLLTALSASPDHPAATREISLAYLQAGRPREGLIWAERAVDLLPGDYDALVTLANTQLTAGQYGEALDSYNRAAEIQRLDASARLGRADALIHISAYGLAFDVLLPLTASADAPAMAWERLGYAYMKVRQYEEAIRCYERAIAIEDSNTAALNGLGVALVSRHLAEGESDPALLQRAAESWRKSLAIDPNQNRIKDLISRFQVFRR